MIFGWKLSHFTLICCTDLSCSLSCIQHGAEDSHAFLLRWLSFWSQDLVSTWFSLWILNTAALTYSRTLFNIAKPSLKRHLVVVVLPDFAQLLLFFLPLSFLPFCHVYFARIRFCLSSPCAWWKTFPCDLLGNKRMSWLSWSLWLVSVLGLPFWNSIRCSVSLQSVPQVSPEGLHILTGACGRGRQPCSTSTMSGAGNDEAIQFRFVDWLVQLQPANGISDRSPDFTIQTLQYRAADYFECCSSHGAFWAFNSTLWGSLIAAVPDQQASFTIVSSHPCQRRLTKQMCWGSWQMLSLHFISCYCLSVITLLW